MIKPAVEHRNFPPAELFDISGSFGFTMAEMQTLSKQSGWPDSGDRGFLWDRHFYNPNTQRSWMPNSATARDRAEFYYEEAISKFNSNRTEAINNLAYAIHYIQDVGVPHHSANKVAVLSNHSAFEERASTALLAEDADWGDIDYDINFYNARPSQSAGDFVHEIASRTNPLITVAADENNIAGQNLLIPFLLLDSMQNTSGVLYKFAKEVGMI